MRVATLIESLFLSYLSRPAADRAVYRAVCRHRPARIVEIAVAELRRTTRIARLAQALRPGEPIRYTVLDQFELGGGELSLKETYRSLRKLGLRARVAPGDPLSAVTRTANELPASDLILVGSEVERDSPAWSYFPRMLHAKSLVLCEIPATANQPARFEPLPLSEIERRAAALSRGRRAA